MLQNPGGLSSTGFSTGQRNDGAKFVQALAAWASKAGGVNGRTIRPILRLTDPTNVEDQAAACRAMVDDAKAFGVVDVASMLDTASLDCLTNRSKGDTPLAHSVMWSRAWQARSGGNDVSYQAAVDRLSITWARDLGSMRWFPKGATVGILGDKCPATQPTITDVLAPALEAQGAGKVVIGTHDCNITAVVSDPSNIATRFRLEGVTHVLIVSNFAAAQIFMTTAKSQGYHPQYSASDWFLNANDATTKGYPPDEFDGAVGITSNGASLRPSGKTPYDGWQLCSQIAVDAGLAPIPPDDGSSAELLGLCDNFMLFLSALRNAGPNPTRAGWRAAVTSLGERTSAVFGPSRFGPGKLTGSDQVQTVTWRGSCRCWRSVSGFRPAAA
jgi:ABC-type branched-subunit amino acid transport system substrate-binding protein